ncbi:N-acyl amino acid synthase FeeM domain-containing protein [Halarcobacter sp.]|uniref:N-acyl amino acid synthase FeeM domain-containing protein n=1 Tax=Halarcobacter sp. TaxID=2321133 RepID=UPI003AFFA14F
MSHLNKNISINFLQEFVTHNINSQLDYLPEKFNEEQRYALEVFKKRVFLEETIEETISFNRSLNWDNKYSNTNLALSAEELIEVFKLRSSVYHEISYQKECPDEIDGLNFDTFDKNSAVIYCKNNNEISGTIRLIFDSKKGLPSEEKCSFTKQREEFNLIGEISRNIVKNRNKGLNQEFKYLMCGIYNIFINNNIDLALSGIRADHLKLFEKLGGVKVEKELDAYGNVDIPFLIISYNPSLASRFFKKVFLKQ